MKLRNEIPQFKLPVDFKYIEQANLAADIKNCLTSRSGGVKVIWAPCGSGKSTTARSVLDAAFKRGEISGVIVLTPPKGEFIDPDEWFRANLALFGIETLRPEDQLSDMLDSPMERPFVFVFDQCDNFEFNSATKRLIKTLAEDSVLCKKYVVIALCSSAHKARVMWNWNGRYKITLCSPGLQDAYKWSKREIVEWVGNYLNLHPDSCLADEAIRSKFIKAAEEAGCPEFLVINADPLMQASVKSPEAIWDESAKFYKNSWAVGKQELRWN